MLFELDMFDLAMAAQPIAAKPQRSRPEDMEAALELALDQYKQGDVAATIDLLQEHIPSALSPGPQALAPSLLSLAAIANAEEAAREGLFTSASDWAITAIKRCPQELDPEVDLPPAALYVLMAASMVAGARCLAFEPSQLHVVLDEPAFRNLALAYSRLSPFGNDRLREATQGLPTLRNRIIDQLWSDTEFSKGRKRGETDITEVAYQRAFSLVNSARTCLSSLTAETSSGHSLSLRTTDLIRALARLDGVLLSSEKDESRTTREFLGIAMAGLMGEHGQGDKIEVAGQLRQVLAVATNTLAVIQRGGLFARTCCAPAIIHLRELALTEAGFAEAALRPSLLIRQAVKRYPIDDVDSIVRLQVEITNQGKGTAEQISAHIDVQPDAPAVPITSTPIRAEPLPTGRSTTLEFPLRIARPADVLSLPITVTYTDVFNSPHATGADLRVERQTVEPNWDQAFTRHPYALRPIDSEDNLIGRSAILDAIELNVASGTSTVLWGQKRVGKTSVAQVALARVASPDRRCIYLRRGQLAGLSEGQVAHLIASRIAGESPELTLEVPEETWFGPYLTRLVDWFEDARRSGYSQRTVVVLDEFDELSPYFYLGQRGENLFSTLRTLGESQLTWIFVGGERMPSIFLRHAATLNQVETYRLDYIADPKEIHEIVVEPTLGLLEWEAEAIALVSELSAGNPYFINLLCGRVFREMHGADRSFVDRADVGAAAAQIILEQSPTHWAHFWDDNHAIEPDARREASLRTVCLLTALGVSLSTQHSSCSLESILEASSSLDLPFKIDDAEETLDQLVQRRVVEEIRYGQEVRFFPVVPLFADFLQKHPRATVLPFASRYQPSELPAPPASASPGIHLEQRFPVEEEELISLSEGLTYQDVRIDPIRIMSWLRQFEDDAAILIASRLLKRLVDFYYFDMPAKRRAIDDAFKWLVTQMDQAGVRALQVAGPSGRIVNVHLAYLGPSSKSGADTAREFKTQKRFSRASSIRDALQWVHSDEHLPPNEKFVLVVDDFVGSGSQAARNLLLAANMVRKDARLLKWAQEGHLLFTPLWAFASGVDAIRDDVGDILTAQPARNLDDEDRAFSESSTAYADPDERRYAESVFRQIGSQLQPESPLGWGDCQALVCFENTVPNDTLPPFWCRGIVNEKPWEPLFPRP
jgi:hypothetical protein